jgi:hypothetical protein
MLVPQLRIIVVNMLFMLRGKVLHKIENRVNHARSES